MEKVFITDKQGNKVLPKTHVSAVYDDEGNDLGSHLGAFEDEVRGLVDTPHQEYVTVATYASLPASGSEDTIYRVSNYDGSQSQVAADVYSEYAWDGTQYVFLCVKSAVGEVFDISAYHNNAKYADLNAALTSNTGGVPQSLQKGGMSVKFVQSSDNMYVQYRLMADEWSINPKDWQSNYSMKVVESEKYMGVEATANNRMLSSYDKNGKKVFYGDLETKGIFESKTEKIKESTNYLEVGTDKDSRIHHAVSKKGIHFFPAGIKKPENLRILLMTDNHYDAPLGSSAGERTDGLTADERTQMIFNMIKKEQMNAPIDFIIHTGDVVWDNDLGIEHPTPSDYQIRIKMFKERFLSQLNIPFVACVGNHDRFITNDTWKEVFYTNRQCSFETDNFYFICLDMYHRDESESVESLNKALPFSTHIDWLNSEAEKCHELNKTGILCFHHVNSEDSDEMYEWMAENDFHLILKGHTHVPTFSVSNNVTVINAGWFANRLEYSPYIDGKKATPPEIVNDGGYLRNTYNWGIGLIEIKDGEITYTEIHPEWRYNDTAYWQAQAISDGITVEAPPYVLGDTHDGYFAGGTTEHDIDTVETYSQVAANFNISKLKNNASNSQDYTSVPSVPSSN